MHQQLARAWSCSVIEETIDSIADYQLDLGVLWHKVRDRIAHHNYKPTYDETKEALKTLTAFTKEMPKILHEKIRDIPNKY